VTCDRSVVFSGYSSFLHQKNWLPRYNWNIVEGGIYHHSTNPYIYIICTLTQDPGLMVIKHLNTIFYSCSIIVKSEQSIYLKQCFSFGVHVQTHALILKSFTTAGPDLLSKIMILFFNDDLLLLEFYCSHKIVILVYVNNIRARNAFYWILRHFICYMFYIGRDI